VPRRSHRIFAFGAVAWNAARVSIAMESTPPHSGTDGSRSLWRKRFIFTAKSITGPLPWKEACSTGPWMGRHSRYRSGFRRLFRRSSVAQASARRDRELKLTKQKLTGFFAL